MQYKKPHVTELAGMLYSEKLMNWANQLGLAGTPIRGYLAKKKSGGSEKHNAIKRFLQTGVVEPGFESLIERFSLFMEGKKVLGFEEKIETEHFKGIFDICYEESGNVYVADFKSKCRKLYINHKIQLVCYGIAKSTENLLIVSLEDFTQHELNKKEIPFLKEIILNLSSIHKNLFYHDNV